MRKKSLTTGIQKRAVDNIISGRFKSIAEAMREAGYANSTSLRANEKLAKTKGVQAYLEQLDVVARKAWNMSIQDKVMLTYLEGLEATTRKGKDADVEVADFAVRKAYADKFAEFYGWARGEVPSGGLHQQFNFFGISEEQREAFNNNFKGFLKHYYEESPTSKAGRV